MKKSILGILILSGVLSANCTNNGNNTVTCSDTGLMWQDDSDVGVVKKNWLEAISYCEDLSLAGFSDWRLPNITELKSIIDRQNKINPSLKDGFGVQSTEYFWSSTTPKSDSTDAWGVSFYDGGDYRVNKASTRFVRCTR